MSVRGIAIGDVHLCKKRPVCRKDDNWYEVQLDKLRQVADIASEYDAPLYIAGDFFDEWNSGYRLVTDANNALHPIRPYYIAGNHDLPYHSIRRFFDSPLSVLNAQPLSLDGSVAGLHFGETHTFPKPPKVLVAHVSATYDSDEVWATGTDVRGMIDIPPFEGVRLIITGDFHKSFVYTHTDGRVWLNTGPIFRTSVKERHYEPSCWYFAVGERVVVERIPLKVDVEAVDRTEMYMKQLRDKELFEFADKLLAAEAESMDFMASVEAIMTKNNTDHEIRQMVYNCIEEAR